ncbi:1,6-dihydroxycyclohexa-2,4-diene-1-carboxylate dehydrogenase [Mycobacterium sp. SM1]|uniref:benzoate 1,2-dioxygenase electron transfer component BenC n=1 Tax=Mycobacterium sp. SM1 TaxID=2816243 RepID=UPI001BD123C8|nr:benzoate 1,2-dioxygenase electron transfer component BenC [Mycobacterium sp. SM1]MBS4730291.1 1,6-dihydroxycyclohexa-2,4-diene-1-carboxylate dehydrogenase [Mycobacterium sp. SM1]
MAADAATYRVALSFEDGVTRFITCREGQTVADASYRQRVNIPVDCLDGACGTCKAFCESGRYDGGAYIADALSPEEAAAGYCLPCSMKPRSDLVLQIASTSEAAKIAAARYSGTLTALRQLSATTMQIGIDIPNRSELAFLPGQYVNITVPGTELTRSYSFSNSPAERRLTFLIKLTPGGVMSSYLTGTAALGDTITFTGPHGSFFLREADRPVLMLAGGTGLAPILSMLGGLREQSSRRTVRLIYGVTTDDDLVALDELARFSVQLPGFSWDYCVADPGSTAPNKGPDKAYVTSLLQPAHLNDGDVAVYVCGPPPMVDAVRDHFSAAGFEPFGFYYEKFALAVPATDESAAAPSAAASSHEEQLLPAADARAVGGQIMLPAQDIGAWAGPVTVTEDSHAIRQVAGQEIFPPPGRSAPDAATPPTLPPLPATVSPDGYQIGEEHPPVHASDALFEARQAFELGVLDLTLGRLTSQQLAGYRLLAESTLRYVDGDRLTDAAQYTEANAAFHDYLFTLSGNQHLLQAYHALDIKGRMSEVLRDATWCHPLIARDHVDIVDAVEAGDREAARALIIAHAERSKRTMRRAIADAHAERHPKFATPGRFTGKVVIITGAAQGIGEHTARRISAEGGTLVLADRSALVKELAEELSCFGAHPLAVTIDLESANGAENLIQQALAAFGRVDVLINNVGGAINFKPFTEFTDAEIRAEIERSLLTTLYCCHAVLPSMVRRGHGVIVNISSAATRGIHRIPYSAAKGGVNALTASLAMEYAAAGIRVVATAPGGTQAPPRRISRGTPEPSTDTERAWFQAHIDQTLDSSLMKRYGTLDEQVAAICFLASEEASYITGTVLPVAGGDQG